MMSRKLLLLSLLVLVNTALWCQKITVTGQVISDDTEEPQPFATVQLMGMPIGATTDLDGFYMLQLKPEDLAKSDTLIVSVLGYITIKRGVDVNKPEQVINFRLKSTDYELGEVVIKAGENPANRIVRNIISHKAQNDRFNLDNYQVENYTKLELDIHNIPASFEKKKIMKPFSFIFDNVDSLSDVKPFLPAFVSEVISDVYYTREEGKEKEVPKAQRGSGIETETVTEFIGAINQKFEVYDNWYTILDKPFTSPFSDAGLSYYEYYIMDSAFVKDRWSYKLKFKPRRKQENTFFGDFWVDMNNYAIEIANIRMSPDVNINWVDRIIIYYEAGLVNDSLWLPQKSKMIIDFISAKRGMGIIGRKTSTYKDFKLLVPETAALYKEKKPDNVDPDSLIHDEAYWDQNRHEKLSKNEAAVYKMIDSIKRVPLFKTYVDVVRTVVTGYKVLGPIVIGPYFNAYSQNKVEGHRFKLGIGTSKNLTKKFNLYGYVAYGIRDRSFKYGAKFQYNLSRKPFSYIGIGYKDDLDLTVENSEEPAEDNLLSGIYRRRIPQKLLRVREYKAFLHKGWKGGVSTRLALLNRHLDPYGGDYGFNFSYLPNPNDPNQIDSAVTTTEVMLKIRFAYKEKQLTAAFSQVSLGSRFPIVELQYTSGIPNILGSQYHYHKLNLFVDHWFNVPPLGWMRYNFEAGKVFGNLPYLLLEVHQGNETYFYLRNAFNGMNRYEFASDMYAQIIFEHHWDGFFLNHIPLLRKLKWREVTGFKVLYGTLSKRNKDSNQRNNYDKAFDTQQPGEGVFYGSFDKGPYTELSAGIENILKFIRIDALWRLNYNDARYTSPFTLRGTMVFTF